MKTKFLVVISTVTIITCAVIIYLLMAPNSKPTTNGEKLEFEVVLDLEIPENEWGQVGMAYLTVSENYTKSPTEIINEIFELPNQYSCHLENSAQENGKKKYLFRIYSNADEFLLEHDIPPIRQDNVSENFCFYVLVHPRPVGGSTWWDTLQCDVLTLTLVLPENYGLRSDIITPLSQYAWNQGGYKDNEFSVFTAASQLARALDNNRWEIRATWDLVNFNKLNPLYLEVHYRKV